MLRQNMPQMVIADMYQVAQSTICRIWRRITEILETVLVFTGGGLVETLEEGHILLVDGTYIPTGNRPACGQCAPNPLRQAQGPVPRCPGRCHRSRESRGGSDPFPGAHHDAKVI